MTDISRSKTDAWVLLGELLRDPESLVAGSARRIAVESLRSAIRWGAGKIAVEILKECSPKWEEEYLLKLRFEIDSIKAYDEAQLEKVPEVDAAISELNELIAPKSFHERLLQVVGQWDPASQSVDVDNRLDVQRDLQRTGKRRSITPISHLF